MARIPHGHWTTMTFLAALRSPLSAVCAQLLLGVANLVLLYHLCRSRFGQRSTDHAQSFDTAHPGRMRNMGQGVALRRQHLGVRASEPLLRLFREAALLLGLSQSQQVGFAAARRQGTPTPEPDDKTSDVAVKVIDNTVAAFLKYRNDASTAATGRVEASAARKLSCAVLV